jgi:predicted nucleotidyltransferase
MSSRRLLRGVSFPREDLALEIQVERLKELLRWREYLRILVEAVREVLGDVDVYVFGSAVEGRLTVDSDIDVAVVLPEVPGSGLERARLVNRILEVAESRGVPWWHPFEIHLVTRDRLSMLEARLVKVT